MTNILSQLTNHLIKNSIDNDKIREEVLQLYKDKEKSNRSNESKSITVSPQVKRKEPDTPEMPETCESPRLAHYG